MPKATVNILQKHFKQISYYTVSNSHCILIQLLSVPKSSITSQQIEGIFWGCSMLFTGMFCLQIYYGLLLKEHLPRNQEKLERDYLEHHCERSLKFFDWLSIQVSLF